ncbi:hypothetical protein B0J13DRAFT_55800 [Dactylonectria estremocensis]|uniref:Uncharacterized protein n=1 Tax=Dactylonectria estremocensis TaxID=1079267 RepID=A0A9P9ENC3_9HYPO|nr:hypothetical protein B0J13DRAFT_55800 [Dactylonectria estremocensis]
MVKYKREFPQAFRIIPALRNFAPGFAPRSPKFTTPGDSRQSIKPHSIGITLQSIYHDLGVVVFHGAPVAQVARIGYLLRKLMEHGPNLKRIYSETPDQSVKVLTQRIPTEDWHIDPFHRTKEGYLSTDALFEYSRTLAYQWARLALNRVEGDEIGFNTVEYREQRVQVNQRLTDGGIIHETINGPRRLPIDAVIQADVNSTNSAIGLHIHYYAAGTGRLVGESKSLLYFFYKAKQRELFPDDLKRIWSASSYDRPRNLKSAEIISRTLWTIERETWAPQTYTSIVHGNLKPTPEAKKAKADAKSKFRPIAKSKGRTEAKTRDEDAHGKSKTIDEVVEIQADTNTGGPDAEVKTRNEDFEIKADVKTGVEDVDTNTEEAGPESKTKSGN